MWFEAMTVIKVNFENREIIPMGEQKAEKFWSNVDTKESTLV